MQEKELLGSSLDVKLFDYIRRIVPQNTSLINEVADVLNVSYDAAYRRISQRSSLSFSDAYRLIKHFKIPINDVYNIEQNENISVKKSYNGGGVEGLESYLKELIAIIDEFAKIKDSKFIYSAKDFPIYHSFETEILRNFKLFSFSYFMSDKKSSKRAMKFEDFKAPYSLTSTAEKVTKSLKKINSYEIWNTTTINTNLYQINFLYNLNLLSKDSAILICDDLIRNLELVEQRAEDGIIERTKVKFSLYFNKMINLNNTVFLSSKDKSQFILPYTTLSFFLVDDVKMSEELTAYFNKQIDYSKKISGEGGIERRLLFNSFYDKINHLKNQIKSQDISTLI